LLIVVLVLTVLWIIMVLLGTVVIRVPSFRL